MAFSLSRLSCHFYPAESGSNNNHRKADNSLSNIVRVVIFFWIIIKVVSWKLWLTNRVFPQVPFLTLPSSLQLTLFILFFVIAIGLFLKPTHPYWLLALLITEVLSTFGDELRWHPWQYQFLFILLAVGINKKNPSRAVHSIMLILASTYFFSGLQKINGGFLQNVWLRLILIRFLGFSQIVYQSRIIRYAGLLIPLLEMIAGILLLLPKQRRIFALLPIGIHAFVWLFLGSAGIQYNQTVLLWNTAMAIIIYILFIKNSFSFSFTTILYQWNIIILIAWLILPIAGFFGYWDDYFSSGVYKGNNEYLNIYIAEDAIVPPELKPYVTQSERGFQGLHRVISVQAWSVKELKTSTPPEHRIYKSIEHSFTERYGYLHPAFMYYH